MVTIEVFADPSINIDADEVAVCLGEEVDITPTVTGGVGSCTIQWERRVGTSGPWLETNNGTAGLGFLVAPGSYQYRALYNCDGADCNEDISNVVTIEVFADPSISIDADEIVVCLGEAVDITPTVTGGVGSCAIQWERRVGTSGPWLETNNGTAGLGFLVAPGSYQYRAIYNCDGAECDEDISNVCLLYTSPSPRD